MFVETKREGETTLEPWRKLVLEAADYMEKHGHCIGTSFNHLGNVCISGALQFVSGALPVDSVHALATTDLVIAFQKLDDRLGGSFIDFNDNNTGLVVVAKLREIARTP